MNKNENIRKITKTLKRKILVTTVIAVILATILASFFYFNFWTGYHGKVDSLRVGIVIGDSSFLINAAQTQNYFSKNGLNVSIIVYSSALTVMDKLLTGEVDIASSSEYVFARKVLDNASICTFGVIDKFFSVNIVARTDKGINNISDLKGKSIGVTLGEITEFYLTRFLELNHLNLSQVTLVNMPYTQTPSALSNGTVDAVVTLQSLLNNIKNLLPNKIVIWPAQSEQSVYRVACTTNNYALMHPEIIVRFVNSLYETENYLTLNPDQSKTILKSLGNYSDAYVQEVWSTHRYSLSLDQSLVAAMQYETRWLIFNNQTSVTSVPNFLDYIYFEGLEAIKPDSINIIR